MNNYSMVVRIAILNSVLLEHDAVMSDEQPHPHSLEYALAFASIKINKIVYIKIK